MQMVRQPLAQRDTNGTWISHDTPSAAPYRISSGGGSCTTSGVVSIMDTSAGVSKQLEFVRVGHHHLKQDKHEPLSSSLPSKAPVRMRTIREQQREVARQMHASVLDNISPPTDAGRSSPEEHVKLNGSAAYIPAQDDIVASPVEDGPATPAPHSASGTESVDINPHPSVTAASGKSGVIVRVAGAHSPPSNKLNTPSRLSLMKRLPQQVKTQPKDVEVAEPSVDVSQASAYDCDAVAAALQNRVAYAQAIREPPSVYRHQPASPCSHLVCSTSAEVASLNESGTVIEGLVMPALLSVGAAKVLPNGLQSPSAITDVGAAPLDYSGLGKEESEPVSNVSPARRYDHHHHQQQQRRSASFINPQTEGVHSSHIGGALQPNAPFHVLQFVSCASTSPVTSPPLLSRREEPHHLHSPRECHRLRVDSDEGADANFRPGGSANRESDGVVAVRGRAAHTTKDVVGGRSSTSSPLISDCELPSLIVCPFALMGCCAEGTHRSADLHKGSTLHHHLMGITKYVQRMHARQQELEQLVHGLQQQVHRQARMLREAREKERARQCPSVSPSMLASLRGASLDSCLHPTHSSASETNAQNEHEGRKALPRDVSIREPPAAEYGIGDEDGNSVGKNAGEDCTTGDSPGRRVRPPHGTRIQRGGRHGVRSGAGHRDSAGLYARQLRMQTSAGQQQPDMVGGPSSTSLSMTRAQRRLRSMASAATSIEAQTTTAAEAHAPGEKMRYAASVQQKQREQHQGSTSRGEKAPSCAPQRILHSDAIDDLSCVSGDEQSGDDGSVQGKRFTETSSAPQLSAADIGTGSPYSPARHNRSAVSPYVHCGAYSRLQPGAGGSTEVSGMSNVPPYQLPNESMSPIRSASLDLDDHEDDTDAGAMHQQLLNLTSAEMPVPTTAGTSCITDSTRKPAVGTKRKTDRQVSPAASPRSAPSLVSMTYRPSELACAEASDGAGAMDLADRSPPKRGNASVVDAANRHANTSDAPKPFSVDVMRLAAPLQRPTLVRKSDIGLPTPTLRNGTDRSKTPLPPVTPPFLATLAAASGGTAATSTLSQSDVQRPRQRSAPEGGGTRGPFSGTNFDAASSTLSAASLLVAAASGVPSVHPRSVHASYNGISPATPLLEPVSRRSSGRKNQLVHAHSYRLDKDATGKRSGIVAGNVDYALGGSGKSGGRRSRLQEHRRTGILCPLHATSVLSPQEAVHKGVVVHHLGLPPRRKS
ncbi:hypothetical protein, conserved [Leishmania tarentolae]|uniref:Uncharacterized protein n=1 Tax=Leishmania tarentolae TaxID=5689 RepID=A0A640KFQ1_LEITA|nr:hypothetical protein, conserved [Leishmania tarentolae]